MKMSMLIVALLSASSLFSAEIRGKVVGVADGDTISVLDESKVQHKIRLDRIDAPNTQYFPLKARLKNMGRDMKLVFRKRTPTGKTSFQVQNDL